jgi:hypothetical protein
MGTFWSFVTVVLLFVIVRTIFVLRSSKSGSTTFPATTPAKPALHDDPISKLTDHEFNAWLKDEDSEDRQGWSEESVLSSMPRLVERHFYAKIAGTSHKNDDGTSRIAAIKKCSPGDMLGSAWEYDNPYDPNAVAISLEGHQLGYLDARLAGETVRDAKRHGWRQLHYFVHANRDPTSGNTKGATIFVVRLEPESK